MELLLYDKMRMSDSLCHFKLDKVKYDLDLQGHSFKTKDEATN